MQPENLNVWPEDPAEWPRHLNAWRCGYGYSQAELAARLEVSRVTLARWETEGRGMPTMLPLTLKGLAFTHGAACPCKGCLVRYPRAARERDIRETRPKQLRRPARLVVGAAEVS
jgi:DNA-binding XRE family transcriptional regulator